MKNNGFVSSDSEGVNKVLAGGFAYVAAIPDLNDFLVANPGKIQLTSDILYTSYSAWVTHLGKNGSSSVVGFVLWNSVVYRIAPQTNAVSCSLSDRGKRGSEQAALEI